MSDRPESVLDRPEGAALDGVLAMAAVRPAAPAQLAAGGRWSVRFDRHPYAKVITVLSGSCWLRPEGHAPVRLAAGDCFLAARDSGYVTASDLGLSPEPSGPLFSRAVDGVATAGEAPETRLLGGTIDAADPATAALLEGLGPTRVDDPYTASVIQSTLRLLAGERRAERPGGEAMGLHLTRVLHLQLMRHLLASGDGAPRLLAAFRDPGVGAALVAVHREPARAWTVAALAAEASMSRTVFAARFKSRVGMAPMEYVLRRRVAGAASDLAAGRTVAATAARWGYGSESAFSAAFKRVTGRSPASVRRG
ncbi:AraC family transcriptional regulator [Streptomyces sp. NPDC050560]|uniref:AraC family transcriptional regulator n=1 Tax=Streptomyces sp. NPDC050560 TaxID=3365630 RepID=UPI0037B89B43